MIRNSPYTPFPYKNISHLGYKYLTKIKNRILASELLSFTKSNVDMIVILDEGSNLTAH